FVLSRTFVPMMCAKFLPDEPRHRPSAVGHRLSAGTPTGVVLADGRQPTADGRLHEPAAGVWRRLHHHIERGLDRLTRRHERLLASALRPRFAVLGAVALLFVGSLVLTLGIGREFFPAVDAGQITLYVRAPARSRLDTTEKYVKRVEALVRQTVGD